MLYAQEVAVHSPPRTVRNHWLSTLPPHLFEELRPLLRPVELPRNSIINESGKSTEALYFIESGVVSRVARTPLDGSVEVAMVGRSGFIGISLVLGQTRSLRKSIVIVPGEALRIETDEAIEVMSRNPQIRDHLMTYVLHLLDQKAQTVLCNARHQIHQRLARWLLMVNDQVGGSEFSITQDLLSMMLGVRRPSISVALAQLEKEHLISKERVTLRVLDPEALENRACDCYRLLSAGSNALIAGPLHRHQL